MKSKIDWDKRLIYGKEYTYKISPETLSVGRSAEFEIRSMLLPYQMNFENLFIETDEVIKTLRGIEVGSIKIGILYDLINKLESRQKSLLNFQMNKRSSIVEFCSLFCIRDGEDIGIFTEDIIREKYQDWADIPEDDFFLLCANAIPFFRSSLKTVSEKYKTLSEEKTQTSF